ncbi:hypothetical protein ECEC1864_0283, partial [Escherichia coli EC1864]
MRAPARTFTLT